MLETTIKTLIKISLKIYQKASIFSFLHGAEQTAIENHIVQWK